MNFSLQQISSDKWGIYSDARLLATVGCKETCETILANLASGRKDAPSNSLSNLYQPYLASETLPKVAVASGSHPKTTRLEGNKSEGNKSESNKSESNKTKSRELNGSELNGSELKDGRLQSAQQKSRSQPVIAKSSKAIAQPLLQVNPKTSVDPRVDTRQAQAS
jgi:hypothetical protein